MPTILGLATMVCAILFSVAGIARQAVEQGAVSPDVHLHLGYEVWLALASVLIFTGGLIEQLRRARKDIKEGIESVGKVDKKLDEHQKDVDRKFNAMPDQYVLRNYWVAELQTIKETQSRIEQRLDQVMISLK